MKMNKTKIVEYATTLQEMGLIDEFSPYKEKSKCGFKYIKMSQEFKRLFKKYVKEEETHSIAMLIAMDNPEVLFGAICEGEIETLQTRTLALALTHEIMQEVTNGDCKNNCDVCEFLSTIVLDRLEDLYNRFTAKINKYSHTGDEIA